ncbi:MAG: iron-containing alcohol dehydrogenase [Halieaceae bacterium]|jgi:alcohol dehydrogenase|nr:iron-containing alcohol dehydrogenase [Halieaceae bacterium]
MPGLFARLGYRALLGIKKRVIMKPQPRPAVYVGADAALQLCDSLSHFKLRHTLIVTDRPLMELGLLDSLLARLAQHGVQTTVFDGVKPDPTVSVVRAGLELLRSARCDSVLAIGGGSSMDTAKVIALAGANNLQVEECVGLNKAKGPALPLYAIPTTAGTGSEVTLAAIISDDATHQKLVVADARVIPQAAALDPGLMTGLPPAVTAATGMDALTHAIESYINIWDTPECLQYGRAATRLILDNLPRAYSHGDDLAAREAMALASYYAGLAFSTCLVGYVHAVSHQLGGHYGVPHGLGNAMVLPHVLELLEEAAAPRLAELALHCELGDAGEGEKALARKLIDRVWALNAEIGIPRTTEVIQEADIDDIVDAALKEGHGYPVPRFLERAECVSLVRGLMS